MKYIVEIPDGVTPKKFLYGKSGFDIYHVKSFSPFLPAHSSDAIELESQAIKEMRDLAVAAKQQPSVPVQFVMVETVLYPVEEFKAITSSIENCTVEQIGAVLYVRGK